jgi:hypothetical protein
MNRSIFTLVFISLALLFAPCYAQDEDADLRASYGLDNMEVNDYYDDEIPEDADGDGAALTESFDFVVEEEETDEKLYRDPSMYFKTNVLKSSFLFTSAENGVLYLGKENELLLGLTNLHKSTVNISVIRLSLLHPMEPTHYYFQNCSAQLYFQLMKPNTSQTFLYRFEPDSMLQPRDYVVVVNVYFEDELNEKLLYQAVNLTHDFIDAPAQLDTEILFIVFSLLSILGLVIYLIVNFCFGTKIRRTASERTPSLNQTEVREEWISHLQQPKKKSQKGKVSSS